MKTIRKIKRNGFRLCEKKQNLRSLVIQKPIITIHRCFLEFRIIVDGCRKNNVKENVKNYKEAVKTH